MPPVVEHPGAGPLRRQPFFLGIGEPWRDLDGPQRPVLLAADRQSHGMAGLAAERADGMEGIAVHGYQPVPSPQARIRGGSAGEDAGHEPAALPLHEGEAQALALGGTLQDGLEDREEIAVARIVLGVILRVGGGQLGQAAPRLLPEGPGVVDPRGVARFLSAQRVPREAS